MDSKTISPSSHISYKDLPALIGWFNLSIAFIGRFPFAMNIIGVLTLITIVTNSISTAAIASAIQAASTGIGNIVQGRIADRHGQKIPLLILSPINFCAIISIIICSYLSTPSVVFFALCAILGFTTAPLGAFARVRWYSLTHNNTQLSTALSYETTADELTFVFGPALVGILASLVSPVLPLIVTALIVITCVIPFALAFNPSPHLTSAKSVSSPGFVIICQKVCGTLLAMLGLGMFFGAMQTSTTALALAFQIPKSAGLIYAHLGLGAAITALAAVYLPKRLSLTARISGGGVLASLGALSCILSDNPWVLAGCLLGTGLAIGPASVAIFELTGRRAPQGGGTTAITALGAMNVLGVSGSVLITGQIVAKVAQNGFYIAFTAALILAVGGLISAIQERSTHSEN